jgi:glycosyltransferase involved in cell wall biosynthesis
VHIVPFGANLDEIPDRERAVRRPLVNTCRLLFIGRHWERKGGDLAFETLLTLERMGVPARLTVCGCTPPPGMSHPKLRVIPFLDKRIDSHRHALEYEYTQHDFLLLPTRADCTPIVFCEANAFGMPVVSTDTGGVAGVIRDGENGVLLPSAARGEVYAERIAEIFRHPPLYARMVLASRLAYEERLNWDVWGQTMRRLLTLLGPRKTRRAVLAEDGDAGRRG